MALPRGFESRQGAYFYIDGACFRAGVYRSTVYANGRPLHEHLDAARAANQVEHVVEGFRLTDAYTLRTGLPRDTTIRVDHQKLSARFASIDGSTVLWIHPDDRAITAGHPPAYADLTFLHDRMIYGGLQGVIMKPRGSSPLWPALLPENSREATCMIQGAVIGVATATVAFLYRNMFLWNCICKAALGWAGLPGVGAA